MNISLIAYLVAGLLIGWLLRWRYDKFYFDAIAREMFKLQTIVKMLKDEKSD